MFNRPLRDATIIVVFGVSSLLGCGETQSDPLALHDSLAPHTPSTLINPELWRLVGLMSDPFEDRPADVICPARSYQVEFGFFEVDTGSCTYGTFAQPLLIDLEAGDRVRLLMWWYELWAPQPSEGHIALSVGDHVWGGARPPIPGPSGFVEEVIEVPDQIPRGTLVYFHVHNHGYNTWVMAELSIMNQGR